ncbi:hypothetical protein VOLCADRAFT_104076 [Volvox carteri f. nagariensis]|uniref:Uncharacterized protein n=1 Tax=Volvox carteri f. nagariensis TaxID=3068 RepID=D8TR22_VOLCA|nr:uncharacterized protein VOLCADRAFT_104076 [Volvox carteri f. nagariensis]EFJ50260.1 hypothetical protein VOLCADRAFT_104076 [Volvox carteri f. nagariensis]|eukprot:XP_002948880.1 hypothetical protein VOLCADRAFT_104076 [Volvox carteri f. nagariensis]
MAANSVILGLTALVFCTWAVSLAGIASVQQQCAVGWSGILSGVNGLSAGLSCMKLFRYYWFIICLEFVLIVGLGASLASNALAKTRLSWLGLFAVATLLYIQTTDTFLTLESITDDASGSIKHRVRTMVAGSIMTATVNAILIVALGTSPASEEAAAATKI